MLKTSLGGFSRPIPMTSRRASSRRRSPPRKRDGAMPSRWYRGILAQHPDLLRVRLDYARALFEDGQDEEADYNFRLALPDVPEAATANIYGYLNQIEARKRFTYGLSIRGSLDSDINAAPAVRQLT